MKNYGLLTDTAFHMANKMNYLSPGASVKRDVSHPSKKVPTKTYINEPLQGD